MAKTRDNDRSALAVGWQWASRITNASLMMALPAAAGWWGDQKWGTDPWLLILGAVVGVAAGGLSLRQMVRDLEREECKNSPRSDQPRE